MSTNSLTELTAVLAEKVHILESVRENLEEERRCIIAAQPEQLEENRRRAEESMTRLNLLNGRIRTLLDRTGSELGLPETDSISSLIPAIDPEARLKLRKLQNRCIAVVEAISGLLVINDGLIKQSLDIIGRSIALFSRLLGGCETYGAAGQLTNGKGAGGIFCREI
jgi:hypothetical protein